MSTPSIAAVILAAGQGTRLKSELPKVLHEVCGRPMLAYVFDACRAAGVRQCLAVVGHGKDLVIEAFAGSSADVRWIEQSPQLGTGHAVIVCREQIEPFEHVLVLCGDGPLVHEETIRELLDRHLEGDNAATLATALIDDPARYGRIWRDPAGEFKGIVEYLDATPEQRAIHEVNPSYYCFKSRDLLAALDQIKPNNVKGEYYITDVFALMMAAGNKVEAVTAVPPEDMYSINSRKDLALVNDVMRRRVLDRLMDNGVTVVDPATTWIDARATIGRDTIIEPMVKITGPVTVGDNCRVGPLVHLTPADNIADDASVRAFSGASA